MDKSSNLLSEEDKIIISIKIRNGKKTMVVKFPVAEKDYLVPANQYLLDIEQHDVCSAGFGVIMII